MTTPIDIEKAITKHWAKYPTTTDKERRFFEYDMVRVYHQVITIRKGIAKSIRNLRQQIMEIDETSHADSVRLDALGSMIERLKGVDDLQRVSENDLRTNIDGLYRSVLDA